MALAITTTQTYVIIDEVLPPHMKTRTKTVRRKADGNVAVINFADWDTPDSPYTSDDYEIVADAKASKVVDATAAPNTTRYENHELALMGDEKLREIATNLGVKIPNKLADKTTLVNLIIEKQG